MCNSYLVIRQTSPCGGASVVVRIYAVPWFAVIVMATLFAKKKRVKPASADGNKRLRPSPLDGENDVIDRWSGGGEQDSSCNGRGNEATGDRSRAAR